LKEIVLLCDLDRKEYLSAPTQENDACRIDTIYYIMPSISYFKYRPFGIPVSSIRQSPVLRSHDSVYHNQAGISRYLSFTIFLSATAYAGMFSPGGKQAWN